MASGLLGKGYETEIGEVLIRHAFSRLGLKRIVSLIEVGNVASTRVAGKLGMSMESVAERPTGIRELWVMQAVWVPRTTRRQQTGPPQAQA